MGETGFTPGPHVLHVQRLDNATEARFSIQTQSPIEVLALVNLHKGTRADLQLWAAAPDLYEALKYALPLVKSYAHTQGDNADYHAQLVAPIAAALSKAVPESGEKP